jgi:hypothetical protein
MQNKQKLIFHIGAPKVASSTIQQYLKQNAFKYYDEGVLIVDKNLEFISPKKRDPELGAAVIIKELLNDECSIKTIVSKLIKISEKAAELKLNKLVFSVENLSPFEEKRRELMGELFNQLHNEFDFTIIYYIRRQDEWLESAWKQWSLKKHNRPFHIWICACVERGWPNFWEAAKFWSDIVGKDNFLLGVLHQPVLKNESIISDFCHKADIKEFELKEPIMANPMLDPDLLSFIHRHSETILTDDYDTWLNGELTRLGIGVAKKGIRFLNDQERDYILNFFKNDNKNLIEYFINEQQQQLTPYFGLDRNLELGKKPAEKDNRLQEIEAALAATMALLCEVGKFK